MNAIRKNVIQPIIDLWSLIVGLKVTGKYFCQRHVTVHYPRKIIPAELTDTFAGHIELIPSAKDPTIPKCISCMMCATNCPSNCIKVLKQKAPKVSPEQEKEWAEAEARGEKVKRPKAPKNPAKFSYDYSLCSLCGTCIENCPVSSLRFSHDIYIVATDRKELTMDLLARLARQAEAQAGKPADRAPGVLEQAAEAGQEASAKEA
ncbi:MAG: 4Fe-4S binding protein [Desulfovibrionaceae bacterium]|nr:4Fe-4S binding protein [Desulfovibrionaceae bacterium]